MERNLANKNSGVASWFRDQIITRKMASPLGLLILAILSVYMAYATVLISYKLTAGLTFVVGGALLCILSVMYPWAGYVLSFVVCFFLLLPTRLTNVPIPIPTGLIPEFFSYLTLLAILTKDRYRQQITGETWSSPIIWWSLVMVAYLFLIFFNPEMNSKVGWFNFTRKQISFVIFILITYMLIDSRWSLKFFMRMWIIVSTIHALYACKQQWLGFFGWEYSWLMADPKRVDLFINMGFVRRFGLVSDPAAAGILYACGCVLLLILGIRTKAAKKKFAYLLLAVIHFLASSYTGTRTATLMIVAGIAFYCILTLYERRTLIFSAIFGIGLIGLLYAPIYNNMIINRLRSTFEGSKDPSALVRDLNRKMVQPYVWKHPIGGGLNTAGMAGATYNPGHYLSSIPPDSAFMQTMMEQGPIGLAMLLIFYYFVLRAGIKYFYRVKDPYIKTLYVANLVSIFTMMVAQFSQQAIGQYPSVLYFYAGIALLLKMQQFDRNVKTTETIEST